MTAAVVGLGKIGLPLAVKIAGAGVPVVGADINPRVVELVNAGKPLFTGEPELEERLAATLAAGMLRATTSTPEAVAAADVMIVVVPLVVDEARRPDFAGIDAATAEVGGALRPGQLVIYETTLPIGTTRGRFGPALEARSGLSLGDGFLLAFSPERVSSGSVFRDLDRYPKIVGGIDARSSSAAIAFYERVLTFDDRPDLARGNGVWDVGSAEAAEFVKLAETTYRDVNIALANEFAIEAERRGLHLQPIIDAANSQPYSHIHRPGVAVGGHCIPVYPRFYLAGHPEARLVATARVVNEAQPERHVARLAELIGPLAGLTVVVLGAAYRGQVKETAFSGVMPLVRVLADRGAKAVVHDPLYDDHELAELGLTPFVLGHPVDGAILQADHTAYRHLTPTDLPGCRGIVDGRGIVEQSPWLAAGVRMAVVGSPST